MKEIRTQDAVGQVLCHDITRIIKGEVKDAAFRKGHVITEQDIPVLLSLGKDHVYVWENDGTTLHENDAAEVLRQICQGPNMHPTPVKEGKVELVSDIDGLFMADIEGLRTINSIGRMMVATIPAGVAVRKGQRLAGMRVIPLVIKKDLMEQARRSVPVQPLLSVLPFRPLKYAVITTGNEVFHGRIKDTFTPTIVEKMGQFGCEMVFHRTTDDTAGNIRSAIEEASASSDVQMILCTGGMSVDPDDRTPAAIRSTGARIVSYGAPVLPGAMFLMSYLPDGRPLCGLPGCVMYARRTVFDLVLPRILAGVEVTAQWLSGLGNGGFCLNCEVCRFPECGFGKGV